MASINPENFSNSYDPKKQEEANAGFTVPEDGIYLVVNTWIKDKRFANVRKKAIGFHVLDAVKAVDGGPSKEEIEQSIGMNSSFDMWWDVEDKRTQEKISHLSLACRNRKAFNPDDDEATAAVILGVPYYVQFRIKERPSKTAGAKPYREPIVVMMQHAKSEIVAKFEESPDFDEVMGDPADRIKKPYVHGKGGGGGDKGGGGGGGGQSSDPFDDDDLPF